MTAERTPHEWSKNAFFAKAQRYIEEMQKNDSDEWQFAFWAALSLEFIVKAALANISQALVAEGSDWNNLLYSTGQQPNQKKFVPRTADISGLIRNIETAFPEFTKEMLDFAVAHMNMRNRELHSGALAFDDVAAASWMPKFYLVCDFLLKQMGESLESLLGKENVEEAEQYIKAHKDEAAKAVKQNINAHKTIWEELTPEQQAERITQAKAASMRYWGHRVKCPSCGCPALLQGSPAGVPKTEVDDDGIVEKQRMLPSDFECVGCGLKITGYSKLLACDLGEPFISTSVTSPLEYFNVDIESAYMSMMEDDNNEPY